MAKKLIVKEMFYSIQGEGLLIGQPAFFIRFAGCNLECKGCDTKYSWSEEECIEYTALDLSMQIHRVSIPVVLTGGEPLVQTRKILVELICFLREQHNITIETNGTVYIPEMMPRVSLFSISPKLYGMLGVMRRANYNMLDKYLHHYNQSTQNIILKFVVCCEEDIEEIKEIVKAMPAIQIRQVPIILQPDGMCDIEMYRRRLKGLVTRIIDSEDKDYWRQLNVFIRPQLHKIIWGQKRGV